MMFKIVTFSALVACACAATSYVSGSLGGSGGGLGSFGGLGRGGDLGSGDLGGGSYSYKSSGSYGGISSESRSSGGSYSYGSSGSYGGIRSESRSNGEEGGSYSYGSSGSYGGLSSESSGSGDLGGGDHKMIKIIEYYTKPDYKYKYEVHDPKTGDVKEQKEEREGDKVRGEYSLKEADGTIRVVKYEADHKNGFNAKVERKGHAVHIYHSDKY